MKRFLQACSMNGSLYSKKEKTNVKTDFRSGAKHRKNMMAQYDSLYKSQYMAMEKLFRRES